MGRAPAECREEGDQLPQPPTSPCDVLRPVRSCLFLTISYCHGLQVALTCEQCVSLMQQLPCALVLCSCPQGASEDSHPGKEEPPQQMVTVRVMGSRRVLWLQPREGRDQQRGAVPQGLGGTTKGQPGPPPPRGWGKCLC